MSEFTLIGNALHYFEDGNWKLSEDLIEPNPDGGGAVAVASAAKLGFSGPSDKASEDPERAEGVTAH